MKIKKEEIGMEEDIVKSEEIKDEEVLESSLFRASLSRFAYPSSPPSSAAPSRRPPKRPSPDSNPNPPSPSSASLTVTVAVAAALPPVPVRQDGSYHDNDEPAAGSRAVAQAVQAVALRRSPRKRKGETRQSLDTGGGGGVGGDGCSGGSGGAVTTRPSKKMRRGNPRAPDEDLSHLGALPEYLAEGLDVLFCGINPGRTSATVGHHYANGTNHFWPCLHLSGFTPRQLSANEDFTLPEMYNLGLTNLVERASISEARLLKREMTDSAPALLAKIARWRPRVMCFNGKGIWLHVERLLQQQLIHENAANGPRVVVPKRELEHEELKPIIIPDIDQERPVKTERVTIPRSLQQPPPLKKDTSNDGVATTSGVAVPTKQEEEDCEPSVAADTEDQGRPPSKTKRERSVSGARSTTANSSNLDAGRVLRQSASAPVPVARRSAVSSPSSSSPVTPRRTATSTFVYGIQPYKAVHDVVPKNANIRETLFCVFPSSSGRVVSHQRNDKVVLFKKLREELELIKAGTFDTSSMQLVHLARQGA